MGLGYWIWMIPLASENTSIGIVTDETVHPYASYAHSYEETVAWISEHEPALAHLLAGREPLDFKRLRNFSYSSCRVFSSDRWSCVGEAAVFLDPFYSPGGDYIAVGNTITTELIRRDREGRFDRETADLYNDLFLRTMFPTSLEIFRGSYITFGYPQIYTTKMLWDAMIYWGAGPCQLFIQGMLREPQSVREYLPVARRITALEKRIQQLFRDWAKNSCPRAHYDYYDFSLVPFLHLVYLDLMVRKNKEQFLNDLRLNLDRLEEAAQVVFRQAVGETMPEQLERLQGRWVNAWAISLSPDNWEADGLFLPESEPRDLTVMQHALFPNLFGPLPRSAQWYADVLSFCMHFLRGRPFYVFQECVRRFLSLHSRMIYRRLFVKDQRSAPRCEVPSVTVPETAACHDEAVAAS
ncbi:MAG TPA: hypothetical protein VG125_20845 [Pirellulales bacterium]|jgi:hypothetical protein|nr:hypothetical protein [Pirellulales bacterium]